MSRIQLEKSDKFNRFTQVHQSIYFADTIAREEFAVVVSGP